MSQGFKHRAARAATRAMLGGLGPTQASIPQPNPNLNPKFNPIPQPQPDQPTDSITRAQPDQPKFSDLQRKPKSSKPIQNSQIKKKFKRKGK